MRITDQMLHFFFRTPAMDLSRPKLLKSVAGWLAVLGDAIQAAYNGNINY